THLLECANGTAASSQVLRADARMRKYYGERRYEARIFRAWLRSYFKRKRNRLRATAPLVSERGNRSSKSMTSSTVTFMEFSRSFKNWNDLFHRRHLGQRWGPGRLTSLSHSEDYDKGL